MPLTFSEFWGRGLRCSFSFRPSHPPVECRGWSGYSGRSIAAQDTFFEFLGRVRGGPCVLCPANNPRSVPDCGLGNRATHLWHRTVVFSCRFLSRPADPTPLGTGGDLGILATPTVCGFLCSLFSGDLTSPRTPTPRLWRCFVFSSFRRHILARHLHVGGVAVA